MKSNILFAALLLILFAWDAQAQTSLPRYSPRVVYVKLADDAGYTVAEGQLLHDQARALEILSGLGWWSRISTVTDDRLRELRNNAAKSLGRALPDPTAAFHFHLYDPARMDEAIRLLQSGEDVQKVLKMPVPVNAQAPDMTSQQRYKTASTIGINADSVYLVYNNRGTGISICDIEYSFNSNHADLPGVTILGAAPANPFPDDHHGTAVLGEIASKNDGAGTTGIASDSRLYFAAACTLPDTAYDLVAPITAATAAFRPGDVLLLEQQIAGPNYDTVNGATTQLGLVPVEWFEPYYDAIALAVGNNITVVEAAGNGQQNLDAAVYGTGNGGHHPFLPGRGSGALMVGAGGVGAVYGGLESGRATMWYSNYGSRVDVQANGERVTTTGYGNSYATEGLNKFYTADFGGTSSASPIVTGAVALLQSVYKSRNNGQVLSPAAVRAVLVATGKTQQNGTSTAAAKPIGPLPNVYAAIGSALRATAVSSLTNILEARIYPSPNNGRFTIELPAGTMDLATEVSIYDAVGRVVRRFTIPSGSKLHNVDLGGAAAGIYEVQLQHARGTAQQRIVVSR